MKRKHKGLLIILLLSAIIMLAGCSGAKFSAGEAVIIEAGEAKALLGKAGVVLVDMQGKEDYLKGHLQGAVNIQRSDITINVPTENILAPKEQIEDILSQSGISNDSTVVIYDNSNNMDAARLWWTLKIYGHDQVKVISGGIKALQQAELPMVSGEIAVTPAQFAVQAFKKEMLAGTEDVKAQVSKPRNNVVLLDTRTPEEYAAGRIPGAVLYDFINNNFPDGTYKPVRHIRIQYLEVGVKPDKTIILYCKTSIRAAQTYLALYNAGYRNLKLYDGAWLEWSADPSLPAEQPVGTPKIEPSPKDMS